MEISCLNPSFNGRCTRTGTQGKRDRDSLFYVLILVLMEDALAPGLKGVYRLESMVLILVLMEDALARRKASRKSSGWKCLNPCFNGRCTRTVEVTQGTNGYPVLILVLMEDALALFTM